MRILFVLLSSFTTYLFADDAVGNWQVVDYSTKQPMAVVEIVQDDENTLSAKVIKVPENANKTCTKCVGDNKGKELVGLTIASNFSQDGSQWFGGILLDLKSGEEFEAALTLSENGKSLTFEGNSLSSDKQLKQVWKKL